MRTTLPTTLACLLAALSLAACRKDEIVTYRVVKDHGAESSGSTTGTAAPGSAGSTSPAPAAGAPASGPGAANDPQAAMAAMANTAVTTASGPGLVWTAPADWSAGPDRPMRKATLLIPGEAGGPGAELAITAFPGDVGGNLANVNRWRQQLSLPPIGEAELGGALQHMDVGALHLDVVELVGGNGQRVLGAIVPHAGATWFFKVTGPDALVAANKDAFLAFLRTVRPQG